MATATLVRECITCSCPIGEDQQATTVTTTKRGKVFEKYAHADWRDCQAGLRHEDLVVSRSRHPAMDGLVHYKSRKDNDNMRNWN